MVIKNSYNSILILTLTFMSKSIFDYSQYKFSTPKDETNFSSAVNDMNVSAIKEMALLSTKYPDAIRFSIGMPSFETPYYIREAVIKELITNNSIGKYAPVSGIPELRIEIAKRVASDRGWKVDPDKNIIVSAGSIEALNVVFHTLLNIDDEVIFFEPCYPNYIQQAKLVRAKAVFCPLDEERGWNIDLELFESMINSKTKVVVICSPNNPTGTVIPKRTLDEVAEIALKHNLYIIVDEPYDYLTYEGITFYSISQNPEIRSNVILLRSFSKEYCMTGWRVGYIVADESIISQLLKVHDSTVTSASTVSQYAALFALKGDQSIVDDYRKEFTKRKNLACELLDGLSDYLSYVRPQGAYYIFPKIKTSNDIDTYKLAVDILEKAKVVVIPGEAFGPSGKNHLRFTFCEDKENIIEGFSRLREYFTQNW